VHQLAGAWFQLGEYGPALEATSLLRDLAARTGDAHVIVYADIARTDVLADLGELSAAEQSIRHAAETATAPGDRVLVGLKQGLFYIDTGHGALAAGPLRTALDLELSAPSPSRTTLQTLWSALAQVDRKNGDFAGALEKLETARGLGLDDMSYRLI